MADEREIRRLVTSITRFLRDQLAIRTDLTFEDRDNLEIAIDCIGRAFNMDGNNVMLPQVERPLLDIFNQVVNPVPVKDKLQAETHRSQGNEHVSNQRYQEAVDEYSRAINLDKWNAIFYCNRAGAFIELQQYYDAISDCRQAINLNPDYDKAYSRMGQAYALLNRPRRAARCYRQALELQPENSRYQHNLEIAEGQINRGGLELVSNILSSLFGAGSQDDSLGQALNLGSIMIITESHPPTESSESQNSSDEYEFSGTSSPNAGVNTPGIIFPLPYGVINGESEERQPIISIGNENNFSFQNSENTPENQAPAVKPSLQFLQEFQPNQTLARDPCNSPVEKHSNLEDKGTREDNKMLSEARKEEPEEEENAKEEDKLSNPPKKVKLSSDSNQTNEERMEVENTGNLIDGTFNTLNNTGTSVRKDVNEQNDSDDTKKSKNSDSNKLKVDSENKTEGTNDGTVQGQSDKKSTTHNQNNESG